MSTPRSGRATLTAFRAAAHIPRAIWQPCAQLASLALAARPPKPLRQWAINARVVTGAQPGFKDRYRAQLSWFRNTVGSLQLGRLTLDQIAGKVDVDPGQLEALLTSHAERGLVIAIPHMATPMTSTAWSRRWPTMCTVDASPAWWQIATSDATASQ